MIQAARQRQGSNDPSDEYELNEHDHPGLDLDVEVEDCWTTEGHGCNCEFRCRTDVRPSRVLATRRTGSRGGGELAKRPVAREYVPSHTNMAVLYSERPVASWMAQGADWWPRP